MSYVVAPAQAHYEGLVQGERWLSAPTPGGVEQPKDKCEWLYLNNPQCLFL